MSEPTPDPSAKSVTPQRKHRKLMKDGSGTEVWPEAIEKIFVQGLRDYWNSPYATYSQARGRSRWRNQFLVDYLQKAGIIRSKKQVASHIQVLRNMWKGEPEFHLVAGGEELYPDQDSSIPIKLEDHWDNNGLIPFDDDHDSYSPSVSPDFSPPDFQSDFPPTPEHLPNLQPSDLNWSSKPHHGHSNYSMVSPSVMSPSPSVSPYGSTAQPLEPHRISALEQSPFRYGSNQVPQYPASNLPDSRWSGTAPQQQYAVHPARPSQGSLPNPPFTSNRVTVLCLSADGMVPSAIKMDSLVSHATPAYAPMTLRVRLSVPTVTDMRSPSTMHGFVSSVCLASVWNHSGKCTTKVHTGNICISEETGYMDVTHINVGTVNVLLPESPLSRCRWLDPSVQTTITQEIIVDNETLLYVIYDLDRRNGGSMPSAELLGFQKYRPIDKASTPPHDFSPMSTSAHAIPYSRHMSPTTLSYALTPVRYASTASMPC